MRTHDNTHAHKEYSLNTAKWRKASNALNQILKPFIINCGNTVAIMKKNLFNCLKSKKKNTGKFETSSKKQIKIEWKVT